MISLKNKTIIFITLAIIGPVFFMFSNPNDLPLHLLLVPFIYFFIISYLFPSIALDVLGVKSRTIRLIIPIITSVLITAILILGSLDQLGVVDIALLSAILALLSWYVFRLNMSR